MGMKIKELAEKLDMSGKEVLEKARAMGLDVKAVTSRLDDIDEKALENSILAKRSKVAETKIVRAVEKKTDVQTSDNPKVQLKAANVTKVQDHSSHSEKNPKVSVKQTTEEKPEREGGRPFLGTPMPKGRKKPPIGTPMPKKATEPRPDVEDIKSREEAIPTPEVVEEKKPIEAKAATVQEKETQKKEIQAETSPVKEVVRNERPQLKIIKRASEVEATANADANKEKKAVSERRSEQRTDYRSGERRSEHRTDRPDKQARDGRPPRENTQGGEGRPGRDGRSQGGKPQGGKPQGDRPTFAKDKKRGFRGDAQGEEFKGKASKKKGQDRSKGSGKKTYGKEENATYKSLEKKVRKKYVKPKTVEEIPQEVQVVPEGTTVINVPITVAGFCEQAGVTMSEVIMSLLKMGIVANQNQNIDEVTVSTLAEEMNLEIIVGQVEEEVIEAGLELFEDREKDLEDRAPIITVMGHVDHGKTSLLDAIRKTNVTEKESGGITQHIGASEVEISGRKIVFLDTPGHEAFTAMRARGANITDIAVLVVAADDSVKPQTIESISHAKAAGVPIIVAINKMDKPGANPERVKQDLTEHGVVVEEYGGDVISVAVSAKKGEGIVSLLEMILLQAEVLELKANPNRQAMGTVIEARLDKAKGSVASLLITNGTLKVGQSVVAGTTAGRVRLMTGAKGENLIKAGPATAVEILGLADVPAAGDNFNAVSDDKLAKDIVEKRKLKLREEVMTGTSGSTLEKLFSQMEDGVAKELNLIVKADVRGSVGALVASLEKLSGKEVKVRIIHSGVGAITESDISLAGTSNAILIGFNVRPTAAISNLADRSGVQIRSYNVIYDIIDDIENAMTGMLDPEFEEEILGAVEVRNTFKVPSIGIIAGAYVTSGKIVRNMQVRLLRDGIVVHEGTISSLKRFKDDAKEVAQGFECGIGIENYNDIKEGDEIQCFHNVEVKRK